MIGMALAIGYFTYLFRSFGEKIRGEPHRRGLKLNRVTLLDLDLDLDLVVDFDRNVLMPGTFSRAS
jgi:hypothetical protein